jgi:hypothetical protein
MKLQPIDIEGKEMVVGDHVSITRVPTQLLDGLPAEDQRAISSQVGKTVALSGFDERGFAEIEFEYVTDLHETTFHTIWVEPNCLRKVDR